jgi:hypothetical protein
LAAAASVETSGTVSAAAATWQQQENGMDLMPTAAAAASIKMAIDTRVCSAQF